ncbi:uncharacterized protein BYT42DRAFT_574077 [Radiomyces spectabilis]|uniref:uncharacterized protein n=1 Tax=Radiomyces spectabilis TaxID=64574 RepID=UPI00221EA855|nr:uncharacterized protein BYT42DRAFT_574077 [Radiomyces spectabilis]KAI8376281.1 hypothetical protein BYT42DRAFT_574077 [Radiomyces spectabilis]
MNGEHNNVHPVIAPCSYYVDDHHDAMALEEAYFADYDRAMANAALEADYNDYYVNHYLCDEEDDDMMEVEEEEDDEVQGDEEEPGLLDGYDYNNDSLLRLIVGVQSYLADLSQAGMDKRDSPLLELQYKMYTYLRQRAFDMGLNLETILQC